ncbi:MAG: histidinol-phosphatase HisJ family protein [Clostridia bacterium]|nr:histidinol-phosphatase HisJ family protein [Clostridia bacterium]
MHRADSHVHTHFSFDGDAAASVDSVCLAALDAGMAEITFTDHCDINGEVEGIYPCYDIAAAHEAVMHAREQYADRLIINWGIELGQPNQYPAEAAEKIKRWNFDFVLGSMHNLTGVPDFFFLRYEPMTEAHFDRLFVRSLCEIREIVTFPGVNALAHLTYPCRYYAMAGRTYDPLIHADLIEPIFAEMIRRNVALEINTSNIRKGLDFTMPDARVLKLYRSCGGRLVTLGSDAHSAQDVGADLNTAFAMLRDCGFSEYHTYRGGVPVAHALC